MKAALGLLPILLVAGRLEAQVTPAQAQYDSAYYAWDAGHYPEALSRFDALLASPDGAEYLERIALLTGELYQTTELAPDGNRLQWSRDGRVAAYAAEGGRAGFVVALDGSEPRRLAHIDGTAITLSPLGDRVAYLSLPDTPELRTARALADSLQRAENTTEARAQQQEIARLEQLHSRVMVLDLASGRESELPTTELRKSGLAFTSDGAGLFLVASTASAADRSDIHLLSPTGQVVALTSGPGLKANPVASFTGQHLLYTAGNSAFGVVDMAAGSTRQFEGSAPAFSPDGAALTFVSRAGPEYVLNYHRLSSTEPPSELKRGSRPIATPAISPDGTRVAYSMQLREDWEVYTIGAAGQGDQRVTMEIQHDRNPRWIGNDRILALKGEARHTRSHLYDLTTGESQRLHHNNTVRTVAPEYEWAPAPDGSRILLVADRDGDTITPERGVYLVDLTHRVSLGDVRSRLAESLADENDLRQRGEQAYGPIADGVRTVLAAVEVPRIYEYERALFQFDSKHIRQPGNLKAIEYIAEQVRSFGYEPELQWFEPQPGIRTANIIATLPGTADPDLIYVISSHFDSVESGPGADDDTSGTAALLEAARVLAGTPRRATIKFAWFTGEEAGLLGSREFVRRAVEAGDRIVGALNNDMIGWTNDNRLDNTIRFSNSGIRDIQHAAAFLFTDLITYDAKYYRSTDAAAYYEVYGDIVGGIGSYPILGNPHYHQPHDVLETINHQLVAEVSKTTIATIMLLASSPSRLTGLVVTPRAGGADVSWTPAVEGGIGSYLVAWGPENDPLRNTTTVRGPNASIDAPAGSVISVKSVGALGLTGWDWARAELP